MAAGQEPPKPQPLSPAELRAAITQVGDLDYVTRMKASRIIRRTPAGQAVPALLQGVAEHADGYVRYRALVLLTGFNDPRTLDAMRESLTSPNDRLRAVAYSYFEHHPDRAMMPLLEVAFDREQGEFVRPALVRALAALGRALTDPASPATPDAASRRQADHIQQALIRDAGRGEDFFRSAVIEALGDHRAHYAFDTLVAIAKLDGPLQDDAVLALGKIGDQRALETLARLQRSAPRSVQPSIAAAICLLGSNCGSHEGYLIDTLRFADKNIGFQALLRGAASSLGVLGVAGRRTAVEALFEIGIPAQDEATRAPVALAVATVALRNTPLLTAVLETHRERDQALKLLAEGFDMLEEDFDKERFFAFARRTYWGAPEASSTRVLMEALIGKLDF
jgi:HEAT repeat protein